MYEYNKNYLANTLRSIRLMAGYTQQNIADALNINRSTYSYYETGKTTPDIQTLKVLSKILDVSIEIFFEEEVTKRFSDCTGQRPRKKVKNNPSKIGDLSSDEKTLISILRSSNKYSAENILKLLQDDLDETE